MEKLKFWLDELDLIAKEFNRESMNNYVKNISQDCKKLIWS